MTTVDGLIASLRTAVLGTGLIGGSILRRLAGLGLDVRGWDPDPSTRRTGTGQGLVFADRLADAVRDRDVVFLAGPLASLTRVISEAAVHAPEHAVLTDVGSTKGEVARTAWEQGLAGRFIPGHPMAGAERAGLDSADPALLVGAAWVLCPPPQGPLDRFRTLTRLLIDAFAARVVPMSPEAHDSAVALASHIPHLLAGALAGGVARSPLYQAVLGLAAGSFRDGTRVAGSPSQRTTDMLISNRSAVLTQLAPIRDFLDGLVEALRDGDVEALRARYAEGRALRQALTERATDRGHRRFPTDGPADDERDFLLGVGAAGGGVTACTVADGQVSYTVCGPTGAVG